MKAFILFLCLCAPAWAQLPTDEKDVATYLEDVSVTVETGKGSGTGVIVKKGEDSYILTAGHVIESLRKTRKIIDPSSGSERTLIQFDDAKAVQLHFEGSRIVGRTIIDCEVVHYSDADFNDDVGILHVRKKGFGNRSVVFAPEDKPTSLGDSVKHVGSFLGDQGANSYSEGKVSQVGRLIDGHVYHQLNLTAFPGSSGGAVTFSNGAYLGMLTRGVSAGFVYITPIDRLREWSKRTGYEWLLNDQPAPAFNEIKKKPIEDTGK